MFLIHGYGFDLLSRTGHPGAGMAAADSDLTIAAVLAAVLVGLNLYLATMHWRAYFFFVRVTVMVSASLVLLWAFVVIAHFYGLVTWVGLLVVLITIFVQISQARRRATLDVLTLGIEKRMPLPPLLKALAGDQWAKSRLLQLAANLERGMPLSAALKADKRLLPREAMVSAEMGEATGDLAGALTQAEASYASSAHLRQALLGHTFYLVSLAFALPVALGFVMLFIVPKFIAIFDDFSVDLPMATVWLVRSFYMTYWLWFCLPILAAGLLMYMILCYADFLPLPTLGWGGRFERSRVLRSLALATEAGRPLSETLAALAKTYPHRKTARRLEACAHETRAGSNWNVSLLKHGLTGVHDAALIDAAQRLGNLPWALREVADGNQRRLIYRLEAVLNLVSPLALLAWGAVICFFVVGCFLPLVKMILSLS